MANGRSNVNVLGLMQYLDRQEKQQENQVLQLMDLLSKQSIKTENFESGVNTIEKLKGTTPYANQVGNILQENLSLEKSNVDNYNNAMNRFDEVEKQIRTIEPDNKSEWTDIKDDMIQSVYNVRSKVNRDKQLALDEKLKSLDNIRSQAERRYDTELLKGVLQNPESKLRGTRTQQEFADVASNLTSVSSVQALANEVAGNVFSQKDVATMNERTKKKIDAYGPAYSIGKRGEGMDMMDKATQHQEVASDIVSKLNKRVGTLDFTSPLVFLTEKAGDTKVNRASKYYPNARKQMAKSNLLPFFTTENFRKVYDKHMNDLLSQDYTSKDINAARQGQINTPKKREIAQQLALFDENSLSDDFIERAIDLMDRPSPETRYNNFFSQMIRDNKGKIATTERAQLSPVMHETWKALKQNYFNWKNLSSEYEKMFIDLHSQPSVLPEEYDNFEAVDFETFKQNMFGDPQIPRQGRQY